MADVKRVSQCDIGLLALLVDIARRLAKAGYQRRDLLRFFRHDGQGDVLLRLRSMVVLHCNPPVLPRVDAASFAGSYYCQLKSVQVNRIKLDSIFDRRVLPDIIACRRLNGGISAAPHGDQAEPQMAAMQEQSTRTAVGGAFAALPTISVLWSNQC